MAENTSSATAWWRTVSPAELRESSRVVSACLEGTDLNRPANLELFARALALQQLLGDGIAVHNVASKAYNLIPACPSPGAPAETVLMAEAWVQRGDAILSGLNRCLELLKPRKDRAGEAAITRFHIALNVFKGSCIDAAVHCGLRADIAVRPFRRGWVIDF